MEHDKLPFSVENVECVFTYLWRSMIKLIQERKRAQIQTIGAEILSQTTLTGDDEKRFMTWMLKCKTKKARCIRVKNSMGILVSFCLMSQQKNNTCDKITWLVELIYVQPEYRRQHHALTMAKLIDVKRELLYFYNSDPSFVKDLFHAEIF